MFEDKNLKVYNTDKAALGFIKKDLFPAERAIFSSYLKKDMNILDVGCGAGRTTYQLSFLTDKVIGVDYSEAMINASRERFPSIVFKVADVRKLPFLDEIFDAAIFSFNGLDYLYPKSDRIQGIIEIKRILKGGAYLIYSSHNRFRLPLGRARLKNFVTNFFKGNLFVNYRIDNQQFGPLLTYCGSTWSEKRDLKNLGFEFLGSYGNKYSNPLAISLLESYTYYIFQKK